MKKYIKVLIIITITIILIMLYARFIGTKGLKVNEYKIINSNIPEEYHEEKPNVKDSDAPDNTHSATAIILPSVPQNTSKRDRIRVTFPNMFHPIRCCVNSNDLFFTNSADKPPSAPKFISSKNSPYIVGLTSDIILLACTVMTFSLAIKELLAVSSDSAIAMYIFLFFMV